MCGCSFSKSHVVLFRDRPVSFSERAICGKGYVASGSHFLKLALGEIHKSIQSSPSSVYTQSFESSFSTYDQTSFVSGASRYKYRPSMRKQPTIPNFIKATLAYVLRPCQIRLACS